MKRSFIPLLLAPVLAHAQLEPPLPVDLDPKIETILAPLSGMPSIQRADEALEVELVAGSASDLEGIEAALTPSFGRVRPRIALGRPASVVTNAGSRLWPDRTVDRLEYALPAQLLPDLYDLEVSAAGVGLLSASSGTDAQRRAVSIVAAYPAAPRVVVLSDTHTGDPRAVVHAAEDAVTRDEYAQFIEFVQRSIGNPVNSERWAAFARTVAEINLVRPDFVLVTGDLTFEAHSTILPYEYEDAWRLLDRLEVPAFVAPGNHDLYANEDIVGDVDLGLDGKELWLKYFGPVYYSVDIGPKLHIAGLDTFEWPSRDPFPVEDEFDTLAAGQVLPEQLAWLESDLHGFRTRSTDGVLVTFAHHDPSWNQRRHAWVGEGRLELRDAMAAHGVSVHFSGHTHEDRVARYFNGEIVQTNGRPIDDQPVRELHHILRDGNIDVSGTFSQAQLGAILRDPRYGPLFVSTTTCASEIVGDIWGLGGYWGWRLARLTPRDAKGGLDPAEFGYPATEEFLQQRAERPENWTAEHAQFGLFSYPNFELDQATLSGNDGSAPEATLRVTSGLLADLKIVPRLTIAIPADQPVQAEGGEVLQVRYGQGMAEVLVDALVPAQSQLDIRVRPGSGAEPAEDPDDAGGPIASDPPLAGPSAADAHRFGGALGLGLSLLLGFAIAWRGRHRDQSSRHTS